MCRAENLLKYTRKSARVAKTSGKEFVEIILMNGNERGVCHVESIDLYNLNTKSYKLSYQEFSDSKLIQSDSKKILSRRGSSNTLTSAWQNFDATPDYVRCPGDMSEWVVHLNDREKTLDIMAIRLDLIGNVNMAAFYGIRVWGRDEVVILRGDFSSPKACQEFPECQANVDNI